MSRTLLAVAVIGALCVSPIPAGAQTRAASQPPHDSQEIKLDESTTLKVAALEARMSAVLANFALLQRQAHDLQQEMSKLLDERKTLVQDAARRNDVEVKDPNEWLFDNKGQRFIRNVKPPASAPAQTPPAPKSAR